VLAAALSVVAAQDKVRVVYLPIDERFTTRTALINLAGVASGLAVLDTPPIELLSQKAEPAPLDALTSWTAAALDGADAAVISLEMFVYGGLVSSRRSNMSEATATARAGALFELLAEQRARNPLFRSYVGAVVMRIPSYNTPAQDFEDPWYWAVHGRDLFEFSFLSSLAAVTGNATIRAEAQRYRSLVPPSVVNDWLWRRSRNANVTASFLARVPGRPAAPLPPLWPASSAFPALFVTLDDAAQYGFDVDEANATRAQAAAKGLLGPVVRVYPGADEVGLVTFARVLSDAARLAGQPAPLVGLSFRNASSASLIPNYESQPMLATALDNLAAAGANVAPWNGSAATLPPHGAPAGWEALVLVSNFDAEPQQEAPLQPEGGTQPPNGGFAGLQGPLCGWEVPVAVADTRLSNGADAALVAWLLRTASASCPAALSGMRRFAYAGWNTDGNTLGTSVANAVLLALARRGGAAARADGPAPPVPAPAAANAYFNTLRLVEDRWWQAGYRASIRAWLAGTPNQTDYDLGDDLPFYAQWAGWPLAGAARTVSDAFGTGVALRRAFFPWNRTFEIGLE